MPNFEGAENAGLTQRKRTIRAVVFGLVCLLVVIMLAVPALDSVGHRWVQCEVVASNGEQGGQNATSAWVVVIDTDDCGQLVYSSGVNRDNVDDKAADFEPGKYEFKMGLTSQLAAKGYVPGVNPSFEEYRRTE